MANGYQQDDWARALSTLASGIRQNRATGMEQKRYNEQVQMQKDQFDFVKKQESNRVEADMADRKIRLEDLNMRIKEHKALEASRELGLERAANITEFNIASQPTTESKGDFTTRGKEQLMEGVGPEVGVLNSMANFIGNLGPTAQIAAQGPEQIPGMTRADFSRQEMAKGESAESLSTLPEDKPVDYEQMKFAFDMNIAYGVPLSDEFASIPGVVSAIKKGRTAYDKAQSDSDKEIALSLATQEAELKYTQWRADNPTWTPPYKGPGRQSAAPGLGIPPGDESKVSYSKEQVLSEIRELGVKFDGERQLARANEWISDIDMMPLDDVYRIASEDWGIVRPQDYDYSALQNEMVYRMLGLESPKYKEDTMATETGSKWEGKVYNLETNKWEDRE